MRCSDLEKANKELKEQIGSLKSLSRSQERLERSRQHLEEEVVDLRRRLEAGVMDYSQAEQFRRETEERARQEIQHKLDEVNLFLQVQAKLVYTIDINGTSALVVAILIPMLLLSASVV